MAAPGESGPAPDGWPAATTLTLDERAPTILLFAHPRCPCTRATIRQLATLPVDLRASVTLVLSGPAVGADDDQPLGTLAHDLLDARAVFDACGAESLRFGARTSGHIVAYSPDGRLLFSGGVTPGRGHEGPTDALAALTRVLRHDDSAPSTTTVFGCPIFGADAERTHPAAADPSCCAATRVHP